MITITAAQLFALEDTDNPTVLAVTAQIRANSDNKGEIPRRYILAVRYRLAGGQPERYVSQTQDYPSFSVFVLKSLSAFTRQDVERAINERAASYVDAQVTPDPNAQVGWSTLDSFFV
jgi:hypothetical protein